MKMIIAIVETSLCDGISRALLNDNYRVTQLATTSGFFRGGATTLMVGVDDNLVDKALHIIRDQVPKTNDNSKRQATLFVLNVKSYNRL